MAEEIGSNPTDRGKPGSKRHVVVDRHGTSLAIWLTPANVHAGQLLTALVDAIEPIHRQRGRAGRPRRRPDKLHADKAYSSRANRRALRVRGITPRIARRGIESSERLGRYRWVVEIILTQLTKASVEAAVVGRHHVADLHVIIGDDDPVD